MDKQHAWIKMRRTKRFRISFFVGMSALSENYYNEAPELMVYVDGDTNEYDETVTTGGIISVTYQVGSGNAKVVNHDYTSAIRTSDSFIIPASEIPTGVTRVIVTAIDSVGNVAVQSITVKVKTPETAPDAGSGYQAETLTKLSAGDTYEISRDGGSTWTDITLSGTGLRDLVAGTYQMRAKDVEGIK